MSFRRFFHVLTLLVLAIVAGLVMATYLVTGKVSVFNIIGLVWAVLNVLVFWED
jgi:uncharacterized membrane protein